jgi:hypothetical protein
MLILEVIIFSITMLIALIFVYQLSAPIPVVEDRYSNNLKILGDDVLRTLSKKTVSSKPMDYPQDVLSDYLIQDDFDNFTSNLNVFFGDSVFYNIYVSNGTKTIFWCSSTGDETKLDSFGDISVSHRLISINPHFINTTNPWTNSCKLYNNFVYEGYNGSTYNIILKMWYI